MNVDTYIFQSPYSSQVQVGRLDPNASSDESNSNEDQQVENNTEAAKQESQLLQDIEASKTLEVAPTKNSDALLDLYA